jgi:hypothetical protein
MNNKYYALKAKEYLVCVILTSYVFSSFYSMSSLKMVMNNPLQIFKCLLQMRHRMNLTAGIINYSLYSVCSAHNIIVQALYTKLNKFISLSTTGVNNNSIFR